MKQAEVELQSQLPPFLLRHPVQQSQMALCCLSPHCAAIGRPDVIRHRSKYVVVRDLHGLKVKGFTWKGAQ